MVPEINVFGHIISSHGIRPNEAKTKAVSEAPAPKVPRIDHFLALLTIVQGTYQITAPSHTHFDNRVAKKPRVCGCYP